MKTVFMSLLVFLGGIGSVNFAHAAQDVIPARGYYDCAPGDHGPYPGTCWSGKAYLYYSCPAGYWNPGNGYCYKEDKDTESAPREVQSVSHAN